MARTKNKGFWYLHGWTIIAWSSIFLLLGGALINRNSPTPPKSDLPPHNYLSLFKPTRPLKNKVMGERRAEEPSKNDARSPGYVSRGEAECKYILENIFDKPFNKERPDFLKNDVTGKNLELDLYNAELGLCVEVNGRQHYEYTPYFHSSRDSFYNQRYRDEMKKKKCQENGINYIEIPYTVKTGELRDFIKSKCKDFGYNI